MKGKRIVLGVTGGIAAYKSADLVRRLRESGAEVRVIMSRGALAFITPLTFQAVSGNPVHTELLDEAAESGMGHIELARWATAIVVAPATADFMAKLAHGLAGDLLSTVCLATTAPLTLAPAMNRQMWLHPATQANNTLLQERGVRIAGPATGGQACGETGPGRMVEPVDLVQLLFGRESGALAGRHVVVSAGPTYEDIDPVRYIGNRSSGKMGFAVAEAAVRAGARVSLVAGPVTLVTPHGVERTDVRSARQMRDAVMALAASADVFISVAAVADYTPQCPAKQKMKKGLPRQKIDLVSTPDIVAEVAALEPGPFTVGFAAETDNLKEYALEKLSRKRLDMIAANRVGQDGSGFEGDDNDLLLLAPGDEKRLGKASKQTLAQQLIDEIAARINGKQDIETGPDKNTRSQAGN